MEINTPHNGDKRIDGRRVIKSSLLTDVSLSIYDQTFDQQQKHKSFGLNRDAEKIILDQKLEKGRGKRSGIILCNSQRILRILLFVVEEKKIVALLTIAQLTFLIGVNLYHD